MSLNTPHCKWGCGDGACAPVLAAETLQGCAVLGIEQQLRFTWHQKYLYSAMLLLKIFAW